MSHLFLVASVLLATIVQSSLGFGLGLVATPLLLQVFPDIKSTSTYVAMVCVITQFIMVVINLKHIKYFKIDKMIFSSLFGIPFGVFALNIEGKFLLTVMGLITIIYTVGMRLNKSYRNIQPNSIWAYLFGFFSGVLGGAYNSPGPLAVIFVSSQTLEQKEFKANLQIFFFINAFFTFLVHLALGNIRTELFYLIPITIPVILIGILIGFVLSKFFNEETFRTIVLIALFIIGVRLLLSYFF